MAGSSDAGLSRSQFNDKLLTASDNAFDFRLWFEKYEQSICMYSVFLMAYNYDKLEIAREIYDMMKFRDLKIDYLMRSVRVLSRGRVNFENLDWWRNDTSKPTIVWSDQPRPKFVEGEVESDGPRLVVTHRKDGLYYSFEAPKVCTIYNGDACSVCFTEFDSEMVENNEIRVCTECVDGQTDTSNHIFCSMCFGHFIQLKKRDDERITCMGQNCNAMYYEADMSEAMGDTDSNLSPNSAKGKHRVDPSLEHDPYIDQRDVRAYKVSLELPDLSANERKELAININDLVDEGMICPLCQEYCIVIGAVNSGITNKRYCHACDREICLDCMQQAHPNKSCYEIQRYNKDIIRQTIERAISDGFLHECPSCHVKYTKISGCNKMTCPKCHEYSCYLCGELIKPGGPSNSPYWHFRNPGSNCSTYNAKPGEDAELGNRDYDRTKVLKICKKILAENRHDDRIHYELARQIVTTSKDTEFALTWGDLGVAQRRRHRRSATKSRNRYDRSDDSDDSEDSSSGKKKSGRCIIS